MLSSFDFSWSCPSLSLRRVISVVFLVFSMRFFCISEEAEFILSFAVVEILCLCFSPTFCLHIGQNFSCAMSDFNLSSRFTSISNIAFLFSFSKISFSREEIFSIIFSSFFSVPNFSCSFSGIDFVYLISWKREVIVCSINWTSF